MFLNDRQGKILDIMKEQKNVSIKELATRFQVSEMTIRRDFTLLENENLLARTHGGGINTHQLSFELFMGKRLSERSAEKKAIAQEAACLIEPGDTIILDTGTSVFHLCAYLSEIANLTVATPSLAVASSLFFSKEVKLLVLGGHVKPWSPDLTGSLTEQNIRGLHFKKAFLGADGIHPEQGFSCADLGSANVVREIIKASESVYVLADSSKIGTAALVQYADFSDIDTLITDNTASEKVALIQDKVNTITVAV